MNESVQSISQTVVNSLQTHSWFQLSTTNLLFACFLYLCAQLFSSAITLKFRMSPLLPPNKVIANLAKLLIC